MQKDKVKALAKAYHETSSPIDAWRRVFDTEDMEDEEIINLFEEVAVTKDFRDAHQKFEDRMEGPLGLQRVRKEMAAVGFSNIYNYIRLDPDHGLVLKDDIYENMSPKDMAAIKTIEGTGHLFKVELHPKQPALDKLMRSFGGYDKDMLTIENEFAEMSTEDILNEIEQIIRRGDVPEVLGLVKGVGVPKKGKRH